MKNALRAHWPEYLMEAAELGLFMISACFFVVLIEHPSLPLRAAIDDPFVRRILIGIAMGVTAIAIVLSPLGKRSGAHFNPAVTLTFWRLGKIEGWDALFYVVAQSIGAVAGVMLFEILAGTRFVADPSVNYVATLPGEAGVAWAFVAEVLISFGLMLTVLHVSNNKRLNRYTAFFAGSLVAIYITFEAPISGMSMNPARSLGSALPAGIWDGLWVYFVAPPIGMLAAAQVYLQRHGLARVYCCKLHHENDERCIFRCRYDECGSAEPSDAPDHVTCAGVDRT
ncbi:MAG: aquaporin [Candidatus Methylophosphatis roskildensis]